MKNEIAVQVKRLFGQGLSDAVIAQRIGKCLQSVYNYRKELGLRRADVPLKERAALWLRIDAMLLENRRVLTAAIVRGLGCTAYEVNKRRRVLAIPSPLGSPRAAGPKKPVAHPMAAGFARNAYYDYAGEVKRNLEYLRALDFPGSTEEEFRGFIQTERGQAYIEARYPQIPSLKGGE